MRWYARAACRIRWCGVRGSCCCRARASPIGKWRGAAGSAPRRLATGADAIRSAGLAGLHDQLRPGRPRTHDDEKVAELTNLVVQRKPEHATQWSVRSAAAVTRIPKSTVGRYFARFGLQLHRSKSFKLSTDPLFVEKVRDLVGL
jgi:hypothetical protein